MASNDMSQYKESRTMHLPSFKQKAKQTRNKTTTTTTSKHNHQEGPTTRRETTKQTKANEPNQTKNRQNNKNKQHARKHKKKGGRVALKLAAACNMCQTNSVPVRDMHRFKIKRTNETHVTSH